MSRGRILTWAVVAISTFYAALITWLVGFTVSIDESFAVAGSSAILLAVLHYVYTNIRPSPILASITGAVAAVAWSMMMVAIISLSSLGTGAPLIDHALINMDASIGINVAAIVTWLANYPRFVSALAFIYSSANAIVFVSIIALAATKQYERLWIYCFSLVGAAFVCASLSGLVPAIGAFTALGIPASVQSRLPHGSGIYFVEAFEAFRSQAVRTIDVRHMVAGVVNFPSFHVAMAMGAMYAFRTIRFCAWPSYLWNGLVIVSTIPIGGHYVADLICGAMVWSSLALIGHRMNISISPYATYAQTQRQETAGGTIYQSI